MINIVRLEMVKEKSVEYGDSQISQPEDVAKIGFKLLNKADREMFLVICLNVKNQINSVQVASMGTLGSTIIHPREIFKVAIMSNAASVALIHNHPSGNTEPSRDDINITQRLIEAGELLGIRVLDHVIVADDRFYSFSEKQACVFR